MCSVTHISQNSQLLHFTFMASRKGNTQSLHLDISGSQECVTSPFLHGYQSSAK